MVIFLSMGFFDVLIRPNEAFQMQKGRESFGKAIIPYAVLGIIFGVLAAIAVSIVGVVISTIPALAGLRPISGTIASAGLAIGVAFGIGVLILEILAPIVFTAWIFLVAKLFGGKGNYTRLLYFGSLLVFPLLVASILVGLVSWIPIIGMLVMVAYYIWSIYIYIIVLKVAMELDTVKAILTFVISIVIPIVIIAIIAALGIAAGIASASKL